VSCGKHHETDCSEVLETVQSYLDGELTAERYEKIRVHLDECGPCLHEADLDRLVKMLVARSCGCEPVSAELRERVVARIHAVRIQVTAYDLDG